MAGSSAPPVESAVRYERDEAGVVYAVEHVTADAWADALTEAPAIELADVRVVRLLRVRAPSELPGWLRVELTPLRLAETAPAYGQTAAATAEPAASATAWRWSPHFREPGPGAAEFLAAGVAALRHPLPAPADGRRRLAALVAFGRGRETPLGGIAAVAGRGADALERWLQCTFGTPDAFADAILLARMDDAGAHEAVEALRFLRAAQVRGGGAEQRELALDRAALLEQASAWRFVEGAPFAGTLAAVRGWRARYERAYARQYADVVRERDALARELEAARVAADALRRLDAIGALGPALGAAAIARWEQARTALATLPAEPERGAAHTAHVELGGRPPQFAAARATVAAVRGALDAQRERLARRIVRMELARAELPALDRLLQAIAAADLDGIERVLDDDLARHIEAVLTSAPPPASPPPVSPLAVVAARFPSVDATTVEAAAATFRVALLDAVARAPNGVVPLEREAVSSAAARQATA